MAAAVASTAPCPASVASLLELRHLSVAVCPVWGAAAGCKAWWSCGMTAEAFSRCSAGFECGAVRAPGARPWPCRWEWRCFGMGGCGPPVCRVSLALARWPGME